MYTKVNKLASAVYNDIVSGLRGYHQGLSLSMEQLEDEIMMMRMQVLKEYSLKGILPVKDLYIAINCIEVDCKDLERCKCLEDECLHTPTMHFEIPQLVNDYGKESIQYIGSADRQLPFSYYTSLNTYKNHKWRKRAKNRPYVWIDTTPNENGMYDCFVFNAQLLKAVSVVGIFKDLRQLENYSCCTEQADDNFSFIDNEVKDRLVKQKINYYRQMQAPIKPNTQEYTTG